MSSKPLSPITKAWYKWKSLRWVPGRKRFLVGLDLQGNTFWEFRDTLSSHQHRMRRIAQYPPSTHHGDIAISPQWHSWLRHTRADPPSLTEQSRDLTRQAHLKVLAAAADARWAAKPSFLDRPEHAQPLPGLHAQMPGSGNGGGKIGNEEGKGASEGEGTGMLGPDAVSPNQTGSTREEEKDPWKHSRGGPSEQWEPKAWDGSVAPAKR